MSKTTNKKASTKTTKKTVAVKTKPVTKKVASVKAKVTAQKTVKKVETKQTIKTTKKSNIKNIVKKLFVAIVAIAVIAVAACKIIKMKKSSLKENLKENTFTLVTKDGKEKVDFKLKIADTDPARLKGLQGVKKLDEKTGMLFDFEEPGYYTMWMKGMDIPLDMVFLNNHGKVIVVTENRPAMSEDLISPCSIAYNKLSAKAKKNLDEDQFFLNCEQKYLQKYQDLTRYVIEIPVGTIKKYNITAGDILLKK